MIQLSSDRFVRYIFHRHSRRGLAIAVGIWMVWLLAGRGWPWWAWLPAVILAAGFAYALLMMAVYGYHKATYQRRAEMIRQRLRQANNQTDSEEQPHSSSLTN